ncbi:response regulator transcription factor [Plantactinospora sp. CA-294935]|uniref:helix-turn-helix transcriptional regulator n=1 Tax=Plantactinospora sp. CA-294935 TaxID=3240012 RepID=UPI003D907F7C
MRTDLHQAARPAATRIVLAGTGLAGEALAAALCGSGCAVRLVAPTLAALEAVMRRVAADVVVVDRRGTATEHMTDTLVGLRRTHRLVVLADRTDEHLLAALLAAGADGLGYLVEEDVGLPAFVAAVRTVAAGRSAVAPSLRARCANAAPPPLWRDPVTALSDREREVLELMAAGRSNQGIGDRLFLTPKTVESHIRSIFVRLDLEPAPGDHRRVLAVLTYLHRAAIAAG